MNDFQLKSLGYLAVSGVICLLCVYFAYQGAQLQIFKLNEAGITNSKVSELLSPNKWLLIIGGTTSFFLCALSTKSIKRLEGEVGSGDIIIINRFFLAILTIVSLIVLGLGFMGLMA